MIHSLRARPAIRVPPANYLQRTNTAQPARPVGASRVLRPALLRALADGHERPLSTTEAEANTAQVDAALLQSLQVRRCRSSTGIMFRLLR